MEDLIKGFARLLRVKDLVDAPTKGEFGDKRLELTSVGRRRGLNHNVASTERDGEKDGLNIEDCWILGHRNPESC